MFDCNKELRKFGSDEVSLSESQRDDMRSHRNANRNRLKKSLDVSIDGHQSQGSYAMHTMVQEQDKNYDIDDGVIILKEDLKTNQDKYKSALDARNQVLNAIDDGSFKKSPEVLKNCVRVYYDEGYHIDIPVYRKLDDNTLELASSDWIKSDPKAVTEWFNEEVKEQSPDNDDGRQLRRVVKLIKFFKNSRDSWKTQMPSGLIISSLVIKCYAPNERDDLSFYDTVNSIYKRLRGDLEVEHPILDEKLTSNNRDPKTKFLRDKLSYAVDCLNPLFEGDCKKKQAYSAWHKLYKHQYWEKLEDDCSDGDSQQKQKGQSSATLGIVSIPPVRATKPFANPINQINIIDNGAQDIQCIQQYFPELVVESGEVVGRMRFYSRYVKNRNSDEWTINACNRNYSECFKGDYKIRITSTNDVLAVFETEGKILNLARRLDKHITDLHLNLDESCCLDYFIGKKLTLCQFILNKVYPYFCWQAYYAQFNEIPPCGEYSHDSIQAKNEFESDVKKLGRNSFCFCGSGKKYKKCCQQEALSAFLN